MLIQLEMDEESQGSSGEEGMDFESDKGTMSVMHVYYYYQHNNYSALISNSACIILSGSPEIAVQRPKEARPAKASSSKAKKPMVRKLCMHVQH